MREVSIEERKNVQLEMLKEIDAFCRSNGIRYSLAFGTLLGAIRHKDFIPWDDDVDIMMPLPDLLRFKKEFTSKVLKYCDIDTEPHYGNAFSEIVYLPTYRKEGFFYKKKGIGIDLYPIVSIPKNTKERKSFFEIANKLNKKRLLYLKWRQRFLHYTPIPNIYGYSKSIRKVRDFLFYSYKYGQTGMFYIIAGPFSLRDKMTYDFNLFEHMIDVEFGGNKFMSTDKYDTFLKMRYGDYMQLPPEDQRHPYHGQHYFWK